MKKWTIEELYELWRYRGYGKKAARQMAEKEFNEINKKKSLTEQHQIMQEMTYN